MNQTSPSLLTQNETKKFETVTLRSGLIVAVEAIRLACDLENRGWQLLTREDRLILRPTTETETLSESERELAKKLKNHLMAIALLSAN